MTMPVLLYLAGIACFTLMSVQDDAWIALGLLVAGVNLMLAGLP